MIRYHYLSLREENKGKKRINVKTREKEMKQWIKKPYKYKLTHFQKEELKIFKEKLYVETV